ncbi:peptidoglycan bridge formation glycyltransferase FemA/FemB family protein [Erysipelotrichaceae bacterium HCN-30851]
MEFVTLCEDEYGKFRAKHPCRDFMNSLEAMELKKMNHWVVEYVGVKEGNNILCATPLVSIPVMKIYRFYYAQRGFLIDYQDKKLLTFFVKELTTYLKKKKALYLIADPNILYKERNIDGDLVEGGFDNSYVIQNMEQAGFVHQGFNKYYGTVSAIRWMFSLYLKDKDEKTLLKEMHLNTKRSINKTKKIGIEIKELSIDELDYFFDIMEATSSRRNFEIRDKDFYRNQMKVYKDKVKVLLAYLDISKWKNKLELEKEELEEELQKVCLKLSENPEAKNPLKKKMVLEESLVQNEKKYKDAFELEKKHGDWIPMASSFFLIDENQVVYLYGGGYDEFKRYNAQYALQWSMIQYALKHKKEKYNFYGISGDFDEHAADYGVYEFKRGFNGVVEELIGDFVLPIQRIPYKLYKAIKHK